MIRSTFFLKKDVQMKNLCPPQICFSTGNYKMISMSHYDNLIQYSL